MVAVIHNYKMQWCKVSLVTDDALILGEYGEVNDKPNAPLHNDVISFMFLTSTKKSSIWFYPRY